MDISSRCGGATTDFTSLPVHKRRLPRQQLRRFLLCALQDPAYVCHALTATSRSHDGITQVFAPAPWRGQPMSFFPPRRQAGTYLPSSLPLSSRAHPFPGPPVYHPTAKTRRLQAAVRSRLIHVDWKCTKIPTCSSRSSRHPFWLPGPGHEPHRCQSQYSRKAADDRADRQQRSPGQL